LVEQRFVTNTQYFRRLSTVPARLLESSEDQFALRLTCRLPGNVFQRPCRLRQGRRRSRCRRWNGWPCWLRSSQDRRRLLQGRDRTNQPGAGGKGVGNFPADRFVGAKDDGPL